MKGQKKKKKRRKNENIQTDSIENMGPNKKCNPSKISQQNIPERHTKPITFLEHVNMYSNLIVGVATVLLVIVTAIYISLSWKIANETKRLADVTVKQFKIKSFPSFLILRSNPTLADGRFKDKIEIQNRGEISSYETSIIMFYGVFSKENDQPKKLSFLSDYIYVYRDKDLENIDIFDYSKKILPNSASVIGIDRSMPAKIFDNLKYHLITIRHKVPYDSSFSYETHAFAFEKKKQEDGKYSLRWETLPDSKKLMLFDKLFKSQIIAPNKDEKIRSFFKDYPDGQGLKFYKRKAD